MSNKKTKKSRPKTEEFIFDDEKIIIENESSFEDEEGIEEDVTAFLDEDYPLPRKAKKAKESKKYWTEQTEQAVIDFLDLDTTYWQTVILKHKEKCLKEEIEFDEDLIYNCEQKILESYSLESETQKEQIYIKLIQK